MGLLDNLKQISKKNTHKSIPGFGSFRYAVKEKWGGKEMIEPFQDSSFQETSPRLDMLQYLQLLDKKLKRGYPIPILKLLESIL